MTIDSEVKEDIINKINSIDSYQKLSYTKQHYYHYQLKASHYTLMITQQEIISLLILKWKV